MSVNGNGASAARRTVALSRSADEPAPAEQRALVPVYETSRSDGRGPSGRRPSAPFLAQLIATKHGEPQTREHRRAAPETAAQAYATALDLAGTKPLKN